MVSKIILGLLAVCVIVSVVVASLPLRVEMKTVGGIMANMSEQSPLATIGIDIPTLITSMASLVVVLTALIGLLKWLEWRRKYGRCRTPISQRPLSTPNSKHLGEWNPDGLESI